jgi:hypothetical protein
MKWPESQGKDLYRRGLYIFFQRNVPYPMLMNFDTPDSNLACVRRFRSTTPLQSLNLLNDPVFFRAAQALAARVLREKPGSVDDRASYAFQLCVGREPSARERRRITDFFGRQMDILKLEPESSAKLLPGALEGFDPVEAGAWVGVGRALLNIDEFITRE